MRSSVGHALTLAVVLAAASAVAEPTYTVTQQGFLVDGQDAPVTNPALAATFRLWDESRSIEPSRVVWTGDCTLEVSRGHFAAVLGSSGCGPAFKPADFAGDRWIELSLGGVPLTPRLRVSATPTAIFAGRASDADKLGGQSLSDLDARYVRASGGTGGSVTIGGSITATSFVGSGAGLTAVDAASVGGQALSDLDGRYVRLGANGAVTIAGALTAGSITGSGAGLSGVDAAKVGGQSLADLDARFRKASDPLGLQAVSASGAFTGNGTPAQPLAIAEGAIGAAQLASGPASLAKVSGGLLTAAADGVTLGANLRFPVDTTTACASGNTGTVRWTGVQLQVCTPAGWSSFGGPPLGTQANAAPSCKAIREAGASKGDDAYWIDPDGVGGGAPFQAFCDMTTDGGGWTLCLSNVVRGKGTALADTNEWWTTSWDKGTRVFTRGNKDAGSSWGNFCPQLAASATQVYATVWSETNAVTKGDVCTASPTWFTPNAGHQKLACAGSTTMSALPKSGFQNQGCTGCIYWRDETVPNTSATGWTHNYYGTHVIVRPGGQSAYGNGGVHWGNVNPGMAAGNAGDVHCGSNNEWCYEEYWHSARWKKSMQLWIR